MGGTDREQVSKSAALARLALGDVGAAGMANELAKILDHFSRLAEVDVTGEEPLVRPDVPDSGLRADEPRPSLSRDELLARAPDPRDGFFGVPKTIETKGTVEDAE